MIYTVYQTTNNVNGKIYVGVHKTCDPHDSYLGSGKILKLAIKEYGKENFSKIILFEYDNLIDAYLKESEIVNNEFINRTDTYNLVCGGSISPDRDPTIPRKILKGKDSPNYGRKLSEEQKQKIGKANKGRIKSIETRLKLSKKLSGRISPMKGKQLSESDKQNKSISALNKQKIQCKYCDIISDPGNITLYHNENCKMSPNFSLEMALKRSESRRGSRIHHIVTCPHCNKQGKGGNMTRYHFDNCKLFTTWSDFPKNQ